MSDTKEPGRDTEPDAGPPGSRPEDRADANEPAASATEPPVTEDSGPDTDPGPVRDGSAAPPAAGNIAAQGQAPQRRRTGLVIGIVLALVLSLAALALALTNYLEQDPVDESAQAAALGEEVAGLEARLDAAESDLQAARSEVGELADRLERLGGQFDELPVSALEAAVGELASDLEALESSVSDRLGEFETRMEEVAAEEVRLPQRDLERRVRLQEALALLRMGQDRLELADDVGAARSAFARAGSRLEALDDPGLGSVRRAISAEREALLAWRGTDWDEITGQLRALEDAVADWPVRETELAEVELEESDDGGWMSRARSALARLVEVRRREGEWLTPAEAESLRAGLRARLAAAELAVARRDRTAVAATVERVEQALEEWFDPAASEVIAARETLDSIAAGIREETPPETGEAASMLQSVIERDS